MANEHYHLLCALEGLREFGSPPPIGKSAFMAKVKDCEGPEAAVEALLLGDDLLEREAVLSGEIEAEEADLAVLPASGASDGPPFPPYLNIHESRTGDRSHSAAVDATWEAYFYHVTRMAKAFKSRFLTRWVGYEVGFRNAMVRTRAEKLGLDAGPYLVAEELGDPSSEFERELEQWKQAENPLEGVRYLEQSRWEWLTEQEPWYEFTDDEVLAYGARLLVLVRWHRITRESPAGNGETG